MGGKGHEAKYKNVLTPRQAQRMGTLSGDVGKPVEPIRIGSEWYKHIDPETGLIKILRKSEKKGARNKRK